MNISDMVTKQKKALARPIARVSFVQHYEVIFFHQAQSSCSLNFDLKFNIRRS